MTRGKRKLALTLAVAASLTASLLGVPAGALGEVDLTAEGAVSVETPAEYRDDLAESEVPVGVYKLASVDANGVFHLEERFAGLSENEQWNGGQLGSETRVQELQAAALELIGPTEGEEAEPLAADYTAEVAAEGGEIRPESLGLYLLVPEKVETERWVYTFSPILLALPSVDEGEWRYSAAVTMKPEREPRLTEFVIDKALASYNATLGPTTFVFDVEAARDGEQVYSNVVSLTFSGAGTQSVTVTGIPAGSQVTVTEAYTGASYAVTNGQVSVEIEELPLAEENGAERVRFTNDYTDELIPDGAVVNTFVYDGTGWAWQSSQEG